MDCKNCELPLRTDYSFCANCGAKVIRNRLTLKSLWYDFTERFFNLDNTFLKTFKHLFSRPDDVIVGYINGTRKKYLNPVSYFTIALMLGGLFVYIHTEFFPDALDFKFLYPDESLATEAEKLGQDFQKKINIYNSKYKYIILIIYLIFKNNIIALRKNNASIAIAVFRNPAPLLAILIPGNDIEYGCKMLLKIKCIIALFPIFEQAEKGQNHQRIG